jgi:hypothetical protein
MAIDISKLSVEELDDLIASAAAKRMQLKPDVSDEWPKGQVEAILDPKWAVTANPSGTFLQIRHPGHGWLNFVIAPATRALLVGFLMQHCLLPAANNDGSTPARAPSVGGSTLH